VARPVEKVGIRASGSFPASTIRLHHYMCLCRNGQAPLHQAVRALFTWVWRRAAVNSGTPLGKADAFQSCALNIDDFRDTPDADIAACFYKKVE
jgi:hypothetical protein